MAEGTIKRLTDKGFGFIDAGKEKDLFFHSSSLQGVRFEELREDQRCPSRKAGVRKARVPRTSSRCSWAGLAVCRELAEVVPRHLGYGHFSDSVLVYFWLASQEEGLIHWVLTAGPQ